jgi:acetyl esterase/lipase
MGFSAGGHLAAMCATLWNERFPQETSDETDRLECRPDFAVLVYPVITMAEPWTHGGSKRRLIGADMSPQLAAQLSTDRRVTADTPPCFLVHAADDGGVPVRNSLEFAARCAESKVPVVCHVFATGGHGFGLEGRGDSADWTAFLERWLAQWKHAPKP